MALGNDSSFGQLRGDINVTPLIDVLLVLLIIFMVIVPAVPRGLDAALPQQSANPATKTDTAIVVQVRSVRDGGLSYKINQEDVSVDQLGSRLASILANRVDKVIFVKADDNLEFSTIAQVVDIGKGAGADHVGLMTFRDPI